MSWFSEIAGKAEDLLNRVDQSAAEALQSKSKSRSRSHLDEIPSESNYSPSRVYSTPLRPPISSNTASPSTLERKSSYIQSTATPKRKSVSDDEKLLEFLNANDKLPTSRKERSKITTSPEKKNFPSNNTQSESVPLIQKTDANSSLFSKKEKTADAHDANILQTASEQQLKEEILDKASDSAPAFQSASIESDVFVTKAVAFNQNVSLAENQSKNAETETKISKKVDSWNSQMSSSEKIIRELREREKDLTAAIEAKDSQLAILKVRLQEADQELQIKRNHGKELEAENDRLIKEHAQSAAFQNKTIEVLREQLQQTEAELNKTKEAMQQYQNDHMQKIAKMEEEHRLLVDSYSSLQKKWNEVNERSKDLSNQLKQSTGNFEALQQEYNDYKQKAQRILQSKEKLIGSLKGGHLESDSIEKSEAASALANAEIESIKQERDLMRDELRRANELVATYRAEIQELEKAFQNDAMESQERYKNLKDQLDSERTTKEEFQLLNVQLKEELQILRDELTRTKSSFQSRIQDREIEIEKLRRQLTAKSLSSVSQDELESRLHALTENLIQKQTLVEALSTEKNSLILQRERLEQQLNEALNYGMQQHAYVGINNNDSERKSKAVFLENPFDSALTRKVKRVYTSIDSFSIRLGVFFRRYPITRVFVIIYMLLLHFWVFIVLLTYEPEIHNASYEISKNH
ncbi:golgin subfamily A member 5-like [Argiope bruennichi]|uniref:golgin subfamily A member 5-like n=1 Tax=Argiope bruennichi TaxID=94029 RepID=UPI00249538FD|nr:golgin subfamily A member 5-like [Argiope bruennichi]XP_055949144.1 golgin subfamily A member 5-like [Argiope bruennichi]XP_055949145.1 golgin subfamily A member 5-like [Argiope bruennichi]